MRDIRKVTRRLLGRRLSSWVEFCLDVGEKAVKAAEDFIKDPARVRDELDGKVAEWLDRQARRNVAHCHEMADDGEFLLDLRAKHPSTGWLLMLRRLHISKQTYFRRIAMAILRRRAPASFEALARLGPDKLCDIAVVPLEANLDLNLDAIVDTPRGPMKLRYLTDDELADWWRVHRAVKPVDFWKELDRLLSRLERRIAARAILDSPQRQTLTTLLAKSDVLTKRLQEVAQGVA